MSNIWTCQRWRPEWLHFTSVTFPGEPDHPARDLTSLRPQSMSETRPYASLHPHAHLRMRPSVDTFRALISVPKVTPIAGDAGTRCKDSMRCEPCLLRDLEGAWMRLEGRTRGYEQHCAHQHPFGPAQSKPTVRSGGSPAGSHPAWQCTP